MNLNSTNFHVNGDTLMHHQHSPQFAECLVHDEVEVFEIESSSTSTSINSEFIQPKNYNHQHLSYTSSPKKDKELNLSDYFKSLQM